jgi:photosystem II stability/assembly factor-like uncharacterized protein
MSKPDVRLRRILILFGWLLGLSACSLTPSSAEPAVVPWTAGDGSLGRWEIRKKIEYAGIPTVDLKGDLKTTDHIYLVSLAGFHSESYGITVGPDDDVRFTTDGGETWTKAAGELHCRHGLEIVDDQVAWHCGNGGTRVTTDGGRSWRTVVPSPCASLSFLDAKTGWASSPYTLMSTADGGATWTRLYPPVGENNIAAVALRTAEDGYVLDEDANLYATDDGGQNWEMRGVMVPDGRLLDPDGGPRAVLRFLDENRGLAVFDRLGRSVWFAVTEDGGWNWRAAEILELKDQSYFFHLFLSRDGCLLTATDDFNIGKNYSVVLRYVLE